MANFSKRHAGQRSAESSSHKAPPPLRWEKIYEARERLAKGKYDSEEEVEAVASWLDQVFGNEARQANPTRA